MADPRLTVIQLLPALESGGVEQGVLEVAGELTRRGHRSIVISAGGRLVPRLLATGSEHINWAIGQKSPFTLGYIPRLRQQLIHTQAHILHARSRLPAWIGYGAWKLLPSHCPTRFVTSVHGLYSVKKYSSIMTRGQRVIAVSDTVQRYIREHYPQTPESAIQTIYRGINTNAYYPGFQPSAEWIRNWYAEFPATQGKRLLLLPGRLTRLKGHFDFLALVRDCLTHDPGIHGLIVGGEDAKRRDYARSLYEYVQQQGLTDQVTFSGVRDDLREIMTQSACCFSLSTHPESFGRTTLEALSLGIPVIGYDHGGVGELLARLLPAGRVPLGDHAQLLATSLAFLAAPPRPLPNHYFTTQAMLDQTLDLYQQLAQAR